MEHKIATKNIGIFYMEYRCRDGFNESVQEKHLLEGMCSIIQSTKFLKKIPHLPMS